MLTRLKTPLLALLSILLAGACADRVDWEQARDLKAMDRHWTSAETIWGEAWAFAPGHNQVVDLGPISQGTVLRISLCENSEKKGRVRARVYVGKRRIATFNTTKPEEWTDWRVDTSAYADSQSTCRIVFDCETPFELGVCELFTPAGAPPNALIFLIDTLRQDHVGCFGCERDTTPNIDALAKEAVRFTRLMPQSSWTRPSVASLLTSTYPSTHGANDSTDVCRKDLPWLPESLEATGRETQGYVMSHHCLPVWGIGAQFTRHVDVDSKNWKAADDARLADRVIQALKCLAGRPWLIYAHAMGPHAPYAPPAGYDSTFQPEHYHGTAQENARRKSIDLYDAEIRYTDFQFGRVVQELKRLGLYDNTLIIVVSGNGEEFWEHGGTDHGKTLYEELLRVPVLIKFPGAKHAGLICDEPVEMVDIAPTVLDILEAPPQARFQGRSLLPYIETGHLSPRPGYASLFLNGTDMRCSKSKDLKFIKDLVKGKELWFDLTNDPGEQSPLKAPPTAGKALPALVESNGNQRGMGYPK